MVIKIYILKNETEKSLTKMDNLAKRKEIQRKKILEKKIEEKKSFKKEKGKKETP